VQDPPVPPRLRAPSRPRSFSVVTQLVQDALSADAVSVGAGLWNQEALFSNPFKGPEKRPW
jgi:hypothetical protein